MTYLITGAAGFIGSHLCEKLIEAGNRVVGIDNFDSFYSIRQKKLNLINLNNSKNFFFYEIDIREKDSLIAVFHNNNIDTVVHLAAKAGVRPSIDFVSDYYSVNVDGTLTLLEVMKNHNVMNLLFASSSSVYGNNLKIPFSETDFVDNPISPYAASKKSCELLCHVYSYLHGFNVTCLRFFTVYGPRQRPDLAIHKFTYMIDNDLPVPFFGDGSTARDYTYIDDILQGIFCALERFEGFRVYNLGESRLIDLNTLIITIEGLLNKKAIINRLPAQPGDVKITFAEISKARQELNYNPIFCFSDGMERFIEWYQSNKQTIYSS